MDLRARAAMGRGGWLSKLLLVLSAVFFATGFLHLRADFPNGSPWIDWSKMTDEGWYGGAAIHHFIWGHWYMADSFNPAVAMPVWPAMLGAWFAVTGVSLVAARVLTMLLYGASLAMAYAVVRRAVRELGPASGSALVGALTVLLTVVNPFCYAFDRLAVLEPVLVFWMMLGFWLAGSSAESHRRSGGRAILRWLGIGVVLGLLALTKATGVALVPAVLYLLWAEKGWPVKPGGRDGWLLPLLSVVGMTAVLWLAYFVLCVRPHFMEDYRQLFSINGYNAHLSILPKMLMEAVGHGMWVSPVLYPATLSVLVLSAVWLRELWRMPLFGAAALAMACQMGFVGYHTNFQPRYYLIVALPMVMVLVLGLAALWARLTDTAMHRRALWSLDLLGAAVVVGLLTMAAETMRYVWAPEYSFLTAAQSIAAVVRADGEVKPVLLSDSGDDITMMTGLPSICDAYALHGEDALLNRYQPGWFAVWPSKQGNILQHIAKMRQLYRLDEVARYRVFDDPARDELVLYRLTPK
jgi:4-amino-4-deoxy-L-arabinose transferase-like glycosyltransferase